MPTGLVRHLIAHQEDVWSDASAKAKALPLTPPLVFTGSGSSYYLAEVAAAVARRLGLAASAAAAGDLWSDPVPALMGAGGVVVVSRSGTTSEAVEAAHTARAHGLPVHALTCNPGTPLADAAGSSTVLEADDGTVVMIQSFTAMLLWLEASVALTAGTDPRPLYLDRSVAAVLEEAEPRVRAIVAAGPQRAIFLGAGARFGIACEGALKALEMGGGTVLWYPPLEFRHGPWGSVQEGDVVWLLRQAHLARYELPLIRDLEARGARVIDVARASADGRRRDTLSLPRESSDLFLGPLAVVPLQLFAWAWAISRGQDPDHPRNLTKVVRLD